MGDVCPAKMARLARRGASNRQVEKVVDKVTVEVYDRFEVRAYHGDMLQWSCRAPSGPAANAIAHALRNLQSIRGKIF